MGAYEMYIPEPEEADKTGELEGRNANMGLDIMRDDNSFSEFSEAPGPGENNVVTEIGREDLDDFGEQAVAVNSSGKATAVRADSFTSTVDTSTGSFSMNKMIVYGAVAVAVWYFFLRK